jgi:hypothetical protein
MLIHPDEYARIQKKIDRLKTSQNSEVSELADLVERLFDALEQLESNSPGAEAI